MMVNRNGNFVNNNKFWTKICSPVASVEKRWKRREGRLKGWGFFYKKLHISRICQKIWWNHRFQPGSTHVLGDRTGRYTHTVGYSRWKTSHFDDHHIWYVIWYMIWDISLHSGAMWALGLVVLLVTIAGVLALLVYVLKWWQSPQMFFLCENIFPPALSICSTDHMREPWCNQTDQSRSFWAKVEVLAEWQPQWRVRHAVE